MKYRNYTDEDIINKSKDVKSIAGLLRTLNLKPSGGNYIHLKKNLSRLNVDTTHWTGQGWTKDQQLKDWASYTRVGYLKKHLIKLREHQCEACKRLDWNARPITLEVHHRDGDRTNNTPDNLVLLCPNCHSQTDNWRNKRRNRASSTSSVMSAEGKEMPAGA